MYKSYLIMFFGTLNYLQRWVFPSTDYDALIFYRLPSSVRIFFSSLPRSSECQTVKWKYYLEAFLYALSPFFSLFYDFKASSVIYSAVEFRFCRLVFMTDKMQLLPSPRSPYLSFFLSLSASVLIPEEDHTFTAFFSLQPWRRKNNVRIFLLLSFFLRGENNARYFR